MSIHLEKLEKEIEIREGLYEKRKALDKKIKKSDEIILELEKKINLEKYNKTSSVLLANGLSFDDVVKALESNNIDLLKEKINPILGSDTVE